MLLWSRYLGVVILALGGAVVAPAQIDPYARNLLQLGYDQPLEGRGPQALYAYYYYNNPELFQNTNRALRVAVAPVYFDGELGFRELLSPHTDLGLGISGGGFSDNYYEVRRGHYRRDESFEGYGGGGALKVYHLVNPEQMIPLHAVVHGGFHYSTYARTEDTSPIFELPDDDLNPYVRAGFRLAGKEPLLYPDLAMELSVWYERQWRLDANDYGFANDRRNQSAVELYWLYACLNYAWTNTGHQFAFAFTAGDSQNADRFSSWRLGGVLPLAAEFPLSLPGYYYQEISAQRFAHMAASYVIPLSDDHSWQLRFGAASAYVDYTPGLGQTGHWHTGVGPDLSYTSPNDFWRIILRYGYGFNAERDGREGAHSVGLLCQFNFGPKRRTQQAK